MSKVRIYVDRIKIKQNQREGTNEPVLIVNKIDNKGRELKSHSHLIIISDLQTNEEVAKVVYDDTIEIGPRVWIEINQKKVTVKEFKEE